MSKPYLPAMPVEETTVPSATGKDLWNAGRLAVERYRRFPTIAYYSLSKRTAPAPSLDLPASEPTRPPPVVTSPYLPGPSPRPWMVLETCLVTGRIGLKRESNTLYDCVWGEPVPPGVQDEGWKQPQTNPQLGGATRKDVSVWTGPWYLHARVVEEPEQKELKRYGFDEVRELLVHLPVLALDAHGIRAQIGDYLVWNDMNWEVLQMTRGGRWKSSNQKLFITLACDQQRQGS